MKKPEQHFVNHSEILKIMGHYRYELLEKIKKDPDNKILKYLLEFFEGLSEDLTQELFEKGKFEQKSKGMEEQN